MRLEPYLIQLSLISKMKILGKYAKFDINLFSKKGGSIETKKKKPLGSRQTWSFLDFQKIHLFEGKVEL